MVKAARKYIVALDLGGTKLITALADGRGKILAQKKSESLLYKGAWLENIGHEIDQLLKTKGLATKNIRVISVGTPDIRVVTPKGEEDIREVITLYIKRKYAAKVITENDASCATFGELAASHGKLPANFIFVSIGTGLGGGIIIQNKIYFGTTGVAGEIGHLGIDINGEPCACGNRGCLHSFCSGNALFKNTLLKISREKNYDNKVVQLVGGFEPIDNLKKINAETIFQAAREKDPFAQSLVDDFIKHLSYGLANCVNILNPQAIVLGGGVGQLINKEMLSEITKQTISMISSLRAKNVKIKLSVLKDKAGILGAIKLALLSLR